LQLRFVNFCETFKRRIIYYSSLQVIKKRIMLLSLFYEQDATYTCHKNIYLFTYTCTGRRAASSER